MAPTVLTVDLQADLLVTYYRLLSRRGYRVITAPTRAAGLLAVEREAPRLVISDLRLPDGDGLDIVRAARSRVPPALAIVVSALTPSRPGERPSRRGRRISCPSPLRPVRCSISSNRICRSRRPPGASADGPLAPRRDPSCPARVPINLLREPPDGNVANDDTVFARHAS